MSAELGVARLRKSYAAGGRPAVDDVSFTVAAGEIVVLLGPSGCGKTTTLRCVAGLEHPSAGSIRIGEDVVSSPERGILVPPRARHVGMVFQSYAVWPHMTVRQNVAYPLRSRRTPRSEIGRKVADALELVDLGAYADRPVVALSGGQMQRVALARSMVYEPLLLLLDEPLSNLDAQLRLRLREDLRRIVKRAGLTALYVTHDQTEAVVLADRIGVMRDGKLLQIASAMEIYNNPVDLFTAGFTGASNVIPGRLAARDGEGFAQIETGTGHRILARLMADAGTDAPVRVAVRPENVLLGEGPGGDGAGRHGAGNRFSGQVLAAQYQGTQTAYELAALGARIAAVEVGTTPRYPAGSEVAVSLPPSLCLAYPADGA